MPNLDYQCKRCVNTYFWTPQEESFAAQLFPLFKDIQVRQALFELFGKLRTLKGIRAKRARLKIDKGGHRGHFYIIKKED